MPGTPLSNIIQKIDRSIFHALRLEIIDKGYIADLSLLLPPTPITGITSGPGSSITVLGDVTAEYPSTFLVTLSGSTGNDGDYTIATSVFLAGSTTITIQQTLTSPIIDGSITTRKYNKNPTGQQLYLADNQTIETNMGFSISIHGTGGIDSKNTKKVPRIVVVSNRTLPGDIGGAPDRVYLPIGADPLHPDSYTAIVNPPQTSSFQYDIHIISATANQSRVMHELVSLALPKRGYIDIWEQPGDKIFLENYSYRDIPNTVKGIDERIYLYEVKDIFDTCGPTVQTNIAPISQITVDVVQGSPNDPNSTDIDSFVVD